MTQEKVSERVGKSRAAIANHLRLLRLPAQIQLALQKKEIDMGHARALLSLDSPSMQIKLFREIMKNGYSVRKVEELVQRLNGGEDVQTATRAIKSDVELPGHIEEMKQHVENMMQAPVKLTYSGNGKGKLTISFKNEEELRRIVERIR